MSTALGATATQIGRVLHFSRPTARRLLDGTYLPTPEDAATVARCLGVPERELWRPARWPRLGGRAESNACFFSSLALMHRAEPIDERQAS